MSKIGTTVSVPVSSHAEAQNKLMNAIPHMKAKIESNSGSVVVLKRGSQTKMRILGGFFISENDLPVIATIEFDSNTPNSVNVIVTEHIVVGIMAGMGDKFQQACTIFAKLIAESIKSENSNVL